MTRETKIGLLVGLGFIVVFAVLLSHTDSERPSSIAQQVADQMEARSELYEPEVTDVADWIGSNTRDTSSTVHSGERNWDENDLEPDHGTAESSDTPASPSDRRIERPRPTRITPREPENGLASIETFDPLPSNWYHNATREAPGAGDHAPGASASGDRERTPLSTRSLARSDDDRTLSTFDDAPVRQRIAPPTIVRPQPSPRHAPPTRSDAPDEGLVLDNAEGLDLNEEPGRIAPSQVNSDSPESSTYVVQKGETLGEIASRVYGTVKAVEFLVNANKDSIRDKNSIIEGQTLLTPDWPGADQFEPASNPGVPGLASQSERTITMQSLLDQAADPALRRAPTAVVRNLEREPALRRTVPGDAGSEPERTYTIRPKDTFSSIARNMLGSETLWREIQKVNPDLDPKKLRPGMTIQLPPTQPWNSVVSSE